MSNLARRHLHPETGFHALTISDASVDNGPLLGTVIGTVRAGFKAALQEGRERNAFLIK